MYTDAICKKLTTNEKFTRTEAVTKTAIEVDRQSKQARRYRAEKQPKTVKYLNTSLLNKKSNNTYLSIPMKIAKANKNKISSLKTANDGKKVVYMEGRKTVCVSEFLVHASPPPWHGKYR